MKKITFITAMTALLSWSGMIQAQTPTMPDVTTDESAPKYYFVKSYRSNGYLTANPNGTATHEQKDNVTANSIWYFNGTISNNGTSQFFGKIGNEGVRGKYLSNVGTNTMTTTGTDWYVRAHKYPTDPSTYGLAISIDANLSSNIDANNQNTGTGMYGGTGEDYNGTTWNVVPLETVLAELAATIENESETYTATLNEANSLYTEAEKNQGTYGGYTKEAIENLKEICDENQTAGSTDEEKVHQILILRAAIANFKASPKTKAPEGFYRFKCMNGDEFLAANSFGMKSDRPKGIITNDVNKENPGIESIWKLEYLDAAQTTFSLMNVATGEYINNTYVNDNPAGVYTCFAPQPMTFVYNHKSGTNVSGVDVPAGKVAIKGSDFTIFYNSGSITNYWDGIGSVWSIEPVDQANLAQYITDDNISNLENFYNTIEGDKIYSLNDFKPSMASEEKTALESNKTYENYSSYINAIKETAKKIDENAYYYIVSAYKTFNDGINRYVYVDTDGNLKWKKGETTDISMLWKITTATDDYNPSGYNITSVNYKKSIKTGSYSNPAIIEESDYPMTIEASPAGNSMPGGVLIKHYKENLDKETLALRGSLTGDNHVFASPTIDDNDMGLTTANLDAATYATHFLLVRAESVNLRTQATSNGNWSTAYLPIAVKLPNEAKAYFIPEATNGIATLAECEDNKIAAEDGVLIKSDNAGEFTVSILNESVEKTDNNLLKGSLIKNTVATDVNAYILGNVEGKVGFYQMDGTDRTMAANKAYLELSKSMSQIRSIVIGGPTTGIEETVTSGSEEEYYDLQGRRVMNPVKGIYITKSGKKVLFCK